MVSPYGNRLWRIYHASDPPLPAQTTMHLDTDDGSAVTETLTGFGCDWQIAPKCT